MAGGERVGRRRALLIGIRETPRVAADFPPLPRVAQDVEHLHKALDASGYDVTTCHPEHPVPENRDVDRSSLRERLGAFLNSCGSGDTAFLYVTGHGAFIGERDYLLPSGAVRDSRRGGGALDRETLISADPEGLLLGDPDPDATVVICLDICRTPGPGPGNEEKRHLVTRAGRTFWLYAASQGQAAYADADGASYFARALAEALSPDTPPRTFDEVADHTALSLRGLLAGLSPSRPQPERVKPFRGREASDDPVVCEGTARISRWVAALADSILWQHTSGSPEVHRRIRQKLAELVEETCRAAACVEDPWTDPQDPGRVAIRVVERLGELVERADPAEPDLLSPAETTVLLAAPVLHEYVTARALYDLKDAPVANRTERNAGAATHEAVTHEERMLADARDVYRAHSQTLRTAAALHGRGLTDAARAADHWLRHRFVAGWDTPWEQGGPYDYADRLIALTAEAAGTYAHGSYADNPGRMRSIALQMRQVAGHLTVRPAGDPRINDKGLRAGTGWTRRPEPVPGANWRPESLAQLLWISGLLACDPRRMSGEVVDHLATHSPLLPSDVRSALSEDLVWVPTGECGLDVDFPCRHPALHSAVEHLVEQADSSVRAVHADDRSRPLLNGVPRQVTANRLVAAENGYEIPLSRFRLAEDEIRPLLMGTPLYGDRMLAVRELYQNALDALRLRSMRVAYEHKVNRRAGSPEDTWKPLITFTQGVDDDGRAYIQCEDSGTGMNRDRLKTMFARAGRRFEQDAQFLQERRNWRRAGIELIPLNSRFGIGVFSYFMLAEEVVVWSTPVDVYGSPEAREAVHAEIQAGSGLLRIRQDERLELPRGGTRVRLYLAPQDEQPSVVETLREHLRVSDHPVVAEELDGNGRRIAYEEWERGALRRSPEWYGDALPAGQDTWLVQGKGQVLLDGVLVKDADPVYGHVVNLRERHHPEPSVDRNKMLSYDRDLVREDLLTAVPEAAYRWKTVSLTALWDLTKHEPRLAVALLTVLLGQRTEAVVEPDSARRIGFSARQPLNAVGCFPHDENAARGERHPGLILDRHYENALLDLWQRSRRAWGRDPRERFRPRGYPSPQPIDALLFRRAAATSDYTDVLQAAADADVPLGTALSALRRYAVAGIPVPATADIRALRGLRPTPVMADLYQGYVSLRSVQARDDGRPSPAPHAPIVRVAAVTGRPLGDVVAQLHSLAALDPALPRVPSLEGDLARLVLRRDDVALVHSGGRWHPGVLAPTELPGWDDSPLPRKRLVQLFRLLSPLGFTVSPDWDARLEERPALTERDLLLYSHEFGRREFWHQETPGIRQLLLISAQRGIPVGEVVTRLVSPLHSIGLAAPTVPAELAHWTVPDWCTSLLTGLPEAPAFFSLRQVVICLWAEEDRLPPEDDLAHDLRMLTRCGLLHDSSPQALRDTLKQGLAGPPPSLRATAHTLQGLMRDVGDGTVRPILLMELSEESLLPLGKTAAVLAKATSPHPPRMPEVPARLFDRTPSEATITALRGEFGRAFADRLDIPSLLGHAYTDRRTGSLAHTVHDLAQYVPLGAPPAPGDRPDAEWIAGFVPDHFDLAAFGRGLLGPGTLGPLELVRVAGRFGWSLGRAYDRYSPFRDLGLTVIVRRPDPAEAVLEPDWRDVVLLTTELTGRAPALSGDVDPDHVRLCAEETDLTPAQVRDRLTAYAGLFGLRLPPEKGEFS